MYVAAFWGTAQSIPVADYQLSEGSTDSVFKWWSRISLLQVSTEIILILLKFTIQNIFP